MKSIREISEYLYKNEFNLLRPIEFCEAVLAAYLAQQEPVACVDSKETVTWLTLEDMSGKELYLAPPIKPGFVMVPVDPTKTMTDAAHAAEHCGNVEPHFALAYKAMIQAAQETE